MARLRNRMVKAEFWTDPELLRWHRDKRTTYKGLWALSEDSGCLEDDPFGWKLLLWPSPLDADITIEMLTTWRDELVAAKKLVPYQADGKAYFWCRTFAQHESPRNPQRPDLPLPPWVIWQTETDSRNRPRGRYLIDLKKLPVEFRSEFEQHESISEPPQPEEPPVPETITTKTIVAEAIDRAKEHGVALTDAVTGLLGKEVKKQLTAGAAPTLVRSAVAVIVDENKSPAQLSYVMRDLTGGERGRPRAHSGRSQNGEF